MEGQASIASDVLARYAADAALEVEGVRGLVGGHLPRQRSVRIATGDDGRTSVELQLELEWGAAFAEVGRAVQDRVAGYLARMAGAPPARVDVVVAEVGPVRG
ncbi:MAG TPA: Asp23/Gls24 family envelope stress response protein [Gaiellaceae bacterium]|nr:Asp23/Gls24 family envelope stress response protein [Gaiellaceae bacterium]